MEIIRNFPLFSIILSLLSSVLCTLLGGKAAKRYTALLECVLLAMSLSVLWYTWRTGASFTYTMGEFPAPWGNEIRAGVLEALLASAFLAILICAVQGGWRYLLSDVVESKQNLFFTLVNLFTAALMSLIYTNDIFTGYVFLEIMTLVSCGLIVIRESGRSLLAAVRYMILNLLGSGLFLMGVVMLYNLTGHLLLVPIRQTIGEVLSSGGRTPLTFSIGMITIGLGIKSGLFPFYFWMPDAYGSSTPSSAVILSSLVSKAYIFLLLKILFRAVGVPVYEALPLRPLLMILGILGMVSGSISALRSHDVNRMVAYSSAAQIGYIFMGIGLGGTAGYTAAVFQMIAHAVTKALLFLTTPRLARVSGDSLLFENLQGSGRRAKDAGIFFTIAALSMVGIPLLAGFTVKLYFAQAAADAGSAVWLLAVMLALAVSSLLNALYFLRTVIRIYTRGTGEEQIPSLEVYAREQHVELPEPVPVHISRRIYRVSALVLTAMNLFLGLFSGPVADLIRQGLTMFE